MEQHTVFDVALSGISIALTLSLKLQDTLFPVCRRGKSGMAADNNLSHMLGLLLGPWEVIFLAWHLLCIVVSKTEKATKRRTGLHHKANISLSGTLALNQHKHGGFH